MREKLKLSKKKKEEVKRVFRMKIKNNVKSKKISSRKWTMNSNVSLYYKHSKIYRLSKKNL